MNEPITLHPNGRLHRHPEWRNWRWQMQNRIHDEASLRRYIRPTEDELRAIEATRGVFRWNIETTVSTSETGQEWPILADSVLVMSTSCPPHGDI